MRFPHRVAWIIPARGEKDGHGNEQLDYGEAATRIEDAPAWVQHRTAREQHEPGRDAAISEWTIFSPLSFVPVPTEEEPDPERVEIPNDPRARVEFDGVTFDLDGDLRHPSTPRGSHHIEGNLQVVTG